MKRHDYIIGTMVRNGFRTSLRGFDQFCKCVESYLDDPLSSIESVYNRIAVESNCTRSAVEKNLRHFCISSNASEAISRMFDMNFIDTGTKEIVTMFAQYISLQHGSYEG